MCPDDDSAARTASRRAAEAAGAAPDMAQCVLRVSDALGTRSGVRRVSGRGDGDGGDAEDGGRVWRLLRVVPWSWGTPGWSWRS